MICLRQDFATGNSPGGVLSEVMPQVPQVRDMDAVGAPSACAPARRVRHDLAAVSAGPALPYNSGVPLRATSTGSKQSRGRCTAAPASTSPANAPSITPGNQNHGNRARAHHTGKRHGR